MELVSQLIVEPVVKEMKQLGNLTSYADRVIEMEDKMKVLEGLSDDIQRLKTQHPSMPAHVPVWLEDVKKIKENVDKITSHNIGCFSVKTKFLAGRNASRLTKVIKGLIRHGSDMISDDTIWREPEGCLGRVNSKFPASTSTPVVSVFNSRVKAFNDALKLLKEDDDHKARVIALCGMGGVGKTTLMKQLKKAAEDNKMFKWIVVVTIGKAPMLAIQNAIAVHTGEPLTGTDVTRRATLLAERFNIFSERKERCLVILDDVWEKIKLEDIGLASPLPNGVKLLLTSRDKNICQQIAKAKDADSVLKVVKVDVLEEEEARDLFSSSTGISAKHNHDLYQVGCAIVKKCGCLPLAIKIIAATLKGIKEEKNAWKVILDSLKNNNSIQEIFEPSYKNLELKDKVIFLLCGMFPEDSNIPIEDLTRYAWGLELLKEVSTMEDARRSIVTSVSNLKNAYLMDGDSHHSDFVKLHHLVLAFVVNKVSEGGEDGCWIIHHEDDFSIWSGANDMRQPCKQISLACKGMSEFPSEFKFPDLRVLKLMQGDESVRFPQDFYVGMEKLQVIAFEKLEYPVVPTSFQCSTNLRTLCLHKCSLMFDLSCIGNILNLEVLSFANSGITILPSTFRNLYKLRLLDVTGCYNLVIDDGVLKSLVKLEELYMIPYDEKSCYFTDNNCSELAERSENLRALEFEFIGDNARMKNMSYEKLKRFKLSVGCSFTEVRDHVQTDQVDMHSYENSLKLITNREELLKSKMNELFKITDALYLQVNDMNTLEDVDVKYPHLQHPPQNSSFSKLRLLVVSQCAELKYLFTPSVATSLSKLEYLEVSGCPNMEAIIHTENEGLGIIMFSNLKHLCLFRLPKLLHLCNDVNVELPRLMELQLGGLPITSIYSATSFVSNLSKLEYLDISRCPNMEAVIHTENEGLDIMFSNLKYLRLAELPKLLHFCNKVDVVALPLLMELQLESLPKFTSIYPDVATYFVSSNISPTHFFLNKEDATPKLEKLFVKDCDSIEVLFNMDSGEIEQLRSGLRSIKVDGCNSLVNLFSCNPFPFFNNLQELDIRRCRSIRVLFEIDSGRAGRYEEQDATPKLEKLFVSDMENLKEIWPPLFSSSKLCLLRELMVEGCDSIEVLFNMDFGEIEQLSSGLRSIKVDGCNSLVKLFSCNPFPFFNNLQELTVRRCRSIQELFDIDSGCTGNIGEQVCTSSLRSIVVEECDSLVNLLPRNPMPLFNHLEELEVRRCGSVQVLFDIDSGCTGNIGEQVCTSSLRSIVVWGCDSLVNLFQRNPMPLFNHLEELRVTQCASIEVIFDIDMRFVGETDRVSSSRLRIIRLWRLGNLRKVWRITGNNLIHGFEAVERIEIRACERFTANAGMRVLERRCLWPSALDTCIYGLSP